MVSQEFIYRSYLFFSQPFDLLMIFFGSYCENGDPTLENFYLNSVRFDFLYFLVFGTTENLNQIRNIFD